jgi:hypothetical protein
MRDHGWQIGDRVSLCPNGNESDRVEGTVTAIDEGGRHGVRVQFDRVVRGVDYCTATHDELTLVEASDLVTRAERDVTKGVWNCPVCGRFASEKSADKHKVCVLIQGERESGYHPLYGVLQ